MSVTAPTAPASSEQPAGLRVGVLGRIAAAAARRRGRVVLAWVVALVLTAGLSAAFAGDFQADYTAPGSESRRAQDLLARRFPAQSGDTIDVVVRAEGGVLAPPARASVDSLLADLREVDHVRSATSPYERPGAVSADGRIARAQVQLDVVNPDDMPRAATEEILAAARAVERPGLQVALGGQTIEAAQQGEIGSEGIGLAAAAIILLLVFGSVVAAGLPIVVAVVGLGVSGALVGLVAAVVDVPDWSTSLAAMMGIGVGIDYVLLMVTRYREFVARGLPTEQAVAATADTAGRSVLVAGGTVVISLLGLFAMGLSFMQGAALVTIASVLVVMLAAVTLLPALLGWLGPRVDRLRLPGRRPRGAHASSSSGWWARWSRGVQRRPWPAALAGFGILVLLTLPVLGVRFGFPDAGNNPQTTTSRQAYDLLTDGFGAGANGPLLLAAELPAGGGGAGDLDALVARLRDTAGVAAVSPAQLNPAGDTAVLTVVPTTGPQDLATERLVETLRTDVVPAATAGTGLAVHVGGVMAGAMDSTDNIASRIPLLIGGVVTLSFLLLLVVFRSLAVAVKAAALNLLSIGAAYGVVAMVLEGGWAGRLVGIDTPTPLPAFIPVLMFAVLFGLSMDYEVFLLSRIREHWLRTGDNAASVTAGLTSTARVITAAAAIMVAVFGAFVPSHVVFLKVIGIGLATAILVDATVVRMLLVPSVMHLLGRANWWLPAAVERRLPHVHVEGHPDLTVPARAPRRHFAPGLAAAD
jgi:putative drug exporter of the RND superfamily